MSKLSSARSAEWASRLYNGFCEDCLAENATINNAVFYGNANKEFININSFYVHVFGEFQIDRILNNAFFNNKQELKATKIKDLHFIQKGN